MSQIISTREKEAFKLASGQSWVTASFRAPNGTEQTIAGEYDRHVIAESWTDGEMQRAAVGILWPHIKKVVFEEGRAAILKEHIVARRKAGDKEPRDISPFSLNFNAFLSSFLELSKKGVESWFSSSGMEEALTQAQVSLLSPEQLDSESHLAMVAARVEGAKNLLLSLLGQGLAEDKPRLAQATRILGYCPNDGDIMKGRLMDRIKELAEPRMRKGATDVDLDSF